MKRTYDKPAISTVVFDSGDIVSASSGGANTETGWGPIIKVKSIEY